MSEEEQQPTAQQQSSISINLLKEGMVINVPIGINEDVMNQIVVKWLDEHPALLQQVAKQAMHVKQTELAVIRNISQSKER